MSGGVLGGIWGVSWEYPWGYPGGDPTRPTQTLPRPHRDPNRPYPGPARPYPRPYPDPSGWFWLASSPNPGRTNGCSQLKVTLADALTTRILYAFDRKGSVHKWDRKNQPHPHDAEGHCGKFLVWSSSPLNTQLAMKTEHARKDSRGKALLLTNTCNKKHHCLWRQHERCLCQKSQVYST